MCIYIHTLLFIYIFIYICCCLLYHGHTHKCTELLLIIIIPWKLDIAMCFDSIYLLSPRVDLAFFSRMLNSHCSHQMLWQPCMHLLWKSHSALTSLLMMGPGLLVLLLFSNKNTPIICLQYLATQEDDSNNHTTGGWNGTLQSFKSDFIAGPFELCLSC